MKRDDFSADEISTFLRAVDRHLTIAAKVVIIGGGAAALAYGVTSTTDDIDTINQLRAELDVAVRNARADTGLDIPMKYSSVAEAPDNYEKRLERELPELERLEVFVLEKHDLALSKALRCTEGDLQQIRELHERVGLDFHVLVERFRDDLHPYAVGDPIARRDYFLAVIRMLFGEVKFVEAAKAIPRRPIV